MPYALILLCSILGLSSCTFPGTAPTPTTPTSTESRTVATPTYGSGKMQIEIFADFQCPACINFNESDSFGPILEEYANSGKLMITYRQYPLTKLHPNAQGDAIAALCSAEQGKYMDYKKWLYALEKEKAGAKVSDSDRIALAKTTGLDEAKFTSCLSSRAYEKQVASDIALGDNKKVRGTPAVYLDGIYLDMSIFRDATSFRSFLDARAK